MMNMKLPRRRFLHLAAGAALPAMSRMARAQTYPTRPVRLIFGYAPGASADITARIMGHWLTERLGQPVIVESRPGAGSNIGTEAVVRAVPDGYTLLLVAPANAINATLYDKLNYDFLRDIVPIASLIRFGNVMEVNPTVPVKTVPEFIAYAKANPGKINFASAGAGSTIHMSGELFKMMAGVNMVHVPYRGMSSACRQSKDNRHFNDLTNRPRRRVPKVSRTERPLRRPRWPLKRPDGTARACKKPIGALFTRRRRSLAGMERTRTPSRCGLMRRCPGSHGAFVYFVDRAPRRRASGIGREGFG
jgi:hypothetical protein